MNLKTHPMAKHADLKPTTKFQEDIICSKVGKCNENFMHSHYAIENISIPKTGS